MTSRAFLLVLALLLAPAFAADRPVQDVQSAAERWLPLLDAGRYEEAWDEMDEGSRRRSLEDWTIVWRDQRSQLGAPKARRFRKVSFEIQSVPFGNPPMDAYAFFDAQFEKTGDRVFTEKLLLRRGDDRVWRVQNYSPLPFTTGR